MAHDTRTKTHWANLGERGSYFGMRAAYWAYATFGQWICRFILLFIVGYFFLRSRIARQASREFLDRVSNYPEGQRSLGRKPDFAMVYRHFMSFGLAMCDKLDSWAGKIHLDQIVYQNRSLFEDRLNAGKGGVWITAHLGNIEVCRALGQQARHVPMTVLVHTAHAEKFNRLMREISPNSEIELLQVTDFDIGVAMQLQERITRGHFIFIVGDRIPVSGIGRVIRLPFLGREAPFPVGPFVLASILDCPVGSLFCVREGNRFHLIFDDLSVMQTRDRKQRQQAIQQGATKFVAQLQALCLRYPLQWYNFFDFWTQPGNDNWSTRSKTSFAKKKAQTI